MLNRLFPRDTAEYRGHVAGLWLFGLVLFLKTAISVASMFNSREAAGSADGIPLDSFTPAAASALLSTFILLGWSNLVVCFTALIALVRYRGLVPLMYLLWIVYELGKRGIFLVMPIERTGGSSGAIVTRVILGVMVVGFVLSLRERRRLRR